MSVRRRRFIRTVSYLLAVCVVIAASGYSSFRAKASYEATLERVRFDALSSLCEYMHDLSGSLKLLSVSAGESVADSAYCVGSAASGARGCIGCFEPAKAVNTVMLIEYAYEFSQSFSGTDEERKRASELSDYAEEVYYHLSDLTVAVMNGGYRLSEFGSIYSKDETPYFEDHLDYSNGSEERLFGSAEYAVSAELNADVGEAVTIEQARETAERLTGIAGVLWREDDGENGGSYSLYHGDAAVEICRQGGALLRLINPRPCASNAVTADDALKKAEKFVERNCSAEMNEISRTVRDFTAEFTFAPVVNGVLLLTSTVRVDVCLSDGGVTYFDAENYIKNYRTDVYGADIPDITFLLPQNVSLEKTELCLAEIKGNERLCILALCGYADGKVQIYIDYNSYEILKTAI